MFLEWLSSQTRFETPIEQMKREDLNECLKVFYAAVKQKNGKDFKVSSLRALRAAIEIPKTKTIDQAMVHYRRPCI